MKKLTVLLVFLLLYLLAFPAYALEGARSGLLLWYRSVLPVLFPFMLISGILLRLGLLERAMSAAARPFRFLFGCSPYGAFTILSGFLCGFPMGAKTASDLYRQGKISREEEYILCGFANNLSPSFILSFLAADQMRLAGQGGLFLLHILGAAFLYGLLSSGSLRRAAREVAASGTHPTDSRHIDKKVGQAIAASGTSSAPADLQHTFALIDDCIYDAVQNTVRLGAYIVMFSILSGAVLRLVHTENPAVLFLAACVEVSSGVHLIASSSLPLATRCFLVTVLAAFGGLSALAQTASVASMDRQMFLYYIKSRMKITLLSAFLCMCSILFFRIVLFL